MNPWILWLGFGLRNTKPPLKVFVELFGGIPCWFLMKDGIEEIYGRKVNEKGEFCHFWAESQLGIGTK